MSKSEKEILTQLVRGMVFWGSWSGIHGHRAHAAALLLRDANLARVIPLDSRDGIHSYVVIPPHCEWDFPGNCIRVAAISKASLQMDRPDAQESKTND
jgi:hypothetical protein